MLGMSNFFRPGVEGGEGGGAPVVPPAAKEQTFSQQYVTELREENKTWRIKYQEREAALTETAGKLTAAEKAAQEAQTTAQKNADERVLKAELRAFAIKHGVVDAADALKVLDLSGVKLDADGNIVGADELFEAAKKSKPYLFGTTNTTSTEKKPPPTDGKVKDVRNMTDAEYAAHKTGYIADSRKA